MTGMIFPFRTRTALRRSQGAKIPRKTKLRRRKRKRKAPKEVNITGKKILKRMMKTLKRMMMKNSEEAASAKSVTDLGVSFWKKLKLMMKLKMRKSGKMVQKIMA